ncbi:MAG: hypothetical protein PHP82_00815 [Candidatus ainarchaeum sp.]|nr:hypothetical protein [Candidatus ainarchaeum sp.]
MKKIIFCLLVIVTLFGCTNVSKEFSENDFFDLKKEYFMEESFNPNQDLMNSYINEISLMRSNSSDSLAKVLDFEIASAQSFLYFSKSLEESKKINYFSKHCNTIEYKNTILYLNLAIKYSEQANSIILLPNEIFLIRNNQQETINEINISSKEYLLSMRETC